MKSASFLILGIAVGVALTFAFLKAREPHQDVVQRAAEPRISATANTVGEQVGITTEQLQSLSPAGGTSAIPAVNPEVSDEEPSSPPLRPEFEQLFTQVRARSMRAHLMKEPRDAESAGILEEQWRQYYSGNPKTLQYGIPDIYCRDDWCEIRLLTTQAIDLAQVSEIMTGPSQSAHPKHLGNPVGSDLRVENGVTAVVFYFANSAIGAHP